ncbi:hypothetical protein BGZ63DRAFT_166772 [Mariannaea sp. PMI_226]|nr:hypothetical protein BGZ63DRAFT_166772 [Mariannaea sp. PMI_226]
MKLTPRNCSMLPIVLIMLSNERSALSISYLYLYYRDNNDLSTIRYLSGGLPDFDRHEVGVGSRATGTSVEIRAKDELNGKNETKQE